MSSFTAGSPLAEPPADRSPADDSTPSNAVGTVPAAPPSPSQSSVVEGNVVGSVLITGNNNVVNVGVMDPGASFQGGAAPAISWPDLLSTAQRQRTRFWADIGNTQTSGGAPHPDLYVSRAAAEATLVGFLRSSAPALLLLGEAGIGKTSLLGHWVADLVAGGHAVFFYSAGASIGSDIEREWCRDLGMAGSGTPEVPLLELGELATQANRQVVLIVDGIDEFHADGEPPERLLQQLDRLVGRTPPDGVRVALSCKLTAWSRLERAGATRLFWNRYYHPTPQQPYWILDPLTETEFSGAYEQYRRAYDLQTPRSALPAGVQEQLHTPLLLRILAEAYQGHAVPVLDRNIGLAVYQRYYEDRVRRPQDRWFVAQLIGEMRARHQSTLPIERLLDHPQLGPELRSADPTSSYQQLLNSGILLEVRGDPARGDAVRFTHQRMGAYALARTLLPEVTGDRIATLAQEADHFPLAWDAATLLLVLARDRRLYSVLAQAPAVDVRELAVESLVELYGNDSVLALDILKELLHLESAEAQRTGLMAAFRLGPAARDLYLWAARSASAGLRDATRTTLYLVAATESGLRFVYDLLDALAQEIRLMTRWPELFHLVEFILSVTTTLYISRSEQPTVIARTRDFYQDLAIHRLHLDLGTNRLLQPAVRVFG